MMEKGHFFKVSLLPQGFAIIDADKVDLIEQLKGKWLLDDRTRYRPRAYTMIKVPKKKNAYQKIHLEKIICGVESWQYVRFLNRNTLDCRRANLEVVEFRRDVVLPDSNQRWLWKLEHVVGREVPQ